MATNDDIDELSHYHSTSQQRVAIVMTALLLMVGMNVVNMRAAPAEFRTLGVTFEQRWDQIMHSKSENATIDLSVSIHPEEDDELDEFMKNSGVKHSGTQNIIATDSENANSVQANETAWCIVDSHSMWPGVNKRYWGWRSSIAHGAEAILPCWTWFVKQNITNQNCGFLFQKGMLGRHKPTVWVQHLLDRMNCTMGETKNETMPSTARVWHRSVYQKGAWTDAPAELRHLILPTQGSNDDTNGPLPLEDGKLRVGIVLRSNNRKFANVSSLVGALKRTLGDNTTKIDLQDMTNITVPDQARWFSTKHIIIAVHGASLVNSVFIRPETTVIQIYPKNYYFTGYFESLVSKSGGHNLDWYDGDKVKAPDVHTEMNPGRREAAKLVEFVTIVDDEIAQLAKEAAGRYLNADISRFESKQSASM